MSYTALARKWRPRRFQELTGQEHVVQALANALDSDRVHHAFLFTGTRGVGKTTIARILAKCLNCEQGVSSQPCGVCSACREIDEGRFIDLLEVDAASRTKIDDTRELLDNVPYAPTRGRYKVYLIDEVHMLSGHSFNALLKTLEEPPPHVKFLLATTDPQKLPVTVLSRCLQFNLKRIPQDRIAERMRVILEAESVPADKIALQLVARAADGSLRDGLSLLDQLIAFGGGRVEEAAARAMLGTVDQQHALRLLRALCGADGSALFAEVAALEEWALDHGEVLDGLAALLARVALLQAVPDYAGDELYDTETLAGLAARLPTQDVQLYYQIAIMGRRDLEWAPDPRTGLEMTLLRMLAFRPVGDALPSVVVRGASPTVRPAVPPTGSAAGLTPSKPLAPAGAAALSLTAESWPQIVVGLDVTGLARQLAAHCAFVGRHGDRVRLQLDRNVQQVRTPAATERLAASLSRFLGSTVTVEIDVGDMAVETPAKADAREHRAAVDHARESLEADPTVRALKERFGATLRDESVRLRR